MLKSIKMVGSLCCLFLVGCATIVSGTSQVIHVQAIDKHTQKLVANAKCTLTNSKGVTFPIYGNPGSVNVPREYGGLQAHCIAPQYHQTGTGTGESFNAWTLVDIVFWPSFIVDAATGAAKKYPSYITVIMNKK